MSDDGWYQRSKEFRDKAKAHQIGNKNAWKPNLDKLYEEAKKIVATGVSVVCACEAIGITREQYYRRRRIEMNGRDRG